MILELSAAMLYTLVQTSPVIPTFTVEGECYVDCDVRVLGFPVASCRWIKPAESAQDERQELIRAAQKYAEDYCK